MRNYLKYTLITWALFLSAASATTINVPDDYSTIQAALTVADSSDAVLVLTFTRVLQGGFFMSVNLFPSDGFQRSLYRNSGRNNL